MDHQTAIDLTRHWINSVVIGLNLCPFAQRVFNEDKIRYVVTDAVDEIALLEVLAGELKTLAAAPISITETTLLIHPHALGNFLDYNDFLGAAEGTIANFGLTGIIQIASFHPAYQFVGTDPGDVENYTNRSPLPMLHLLREESIAKVAGNQQELLDIPRRNIATLRGLGRGRIEEMLKFLPPLPRKDG